MLPRCGYNISCRCGATRGKSVENRNKTMYTIERAAGGQWHALFVAVTVAVAVTATCDTPQATRSAGQWHNGIARSYFFAVVICDTAGLGMRNGHHWPPARRIYFSVLDESKISDHNFNYQPMRKIRKFYITNRVIMNWT